MNCILEATKGITTNFLRGNNDIVITKENVFILLLKY